MVAEKVNVWYMFYMLELLEWLVLCDFLNKNLLKEFF